MEGGGGPQQQQQLRGKRTSPRPKSSSRRRRDSHALGQHGRSHCCCPRPCQQHYLRSELEEQWSTARSWLASTGQPTCSGWRPRDERDEPTTTDDHRSGEYRGDDNGEPGMRPWLLGRLVGWRRHRPRWTHGSRDFRRAIEIVLLGLLLIVSPGLCNHQDAVHITAILGESVVFNCHVEFPDQHAVPYVLQWEKKVGDTGQEIPIYIWYESYPTHSGEGYEGRVSKVSSNSNFGVASLNLTNIQESDQGWYECKVVFLNRSPNNNKNGTWFHLDVHAPPRFTITPEEMIYVNLGDAIILNCQAEGTPTPEILWYKDANPVEPSSTIRIMNDGTELRISMIKTEDIGDYTCIARNGEGQISHTARVIIAGGAVITSPPENSTKLEGEKVTFQCEAKAMPGNVTVRWYREGSLISEVSELDTRASIKMDGSLVINPVSADDTGTYLCEVTNGIGEAQTASAFLNVEYPAKVSFNPTVQYLPFRMAGVVHCYIKANPPLQYVTWTKDKRLLEPYHVKDIVVMTNGSLLFTRVNESHQGKYTCTPYNAHGTQGSSGHMEVLVRNPPSFTVEPLPMYQRKVGETVEMHCDAQEAKDTQKPVITWQRKDGDALPKGRAKIIGGNLTIDSLRGQDFGGYECVAANEVAVIVKSTQLIVEGTQPHAPHNLTGVADEFSVTLSWLPGYSGGPDYKQDYTIWYREEGAQDWKTIPVTPSGSTTVTISRLKSGTNHEFRVVGKNALGEGMFSNVITVKTLDVGLQKSVTPSSNSRNQQPATADQSGGGLELPLKEKVTPDDRPRPGPPRNVSVTELSNGFLISWMPPAEKSHLVKFYTINFKTDGAWKTLNKGQIRPEDTSYLMKNLVGGRTYYFVVFANSTDSAGVSDQIKYSVPARVKHKAITAGVVGGILFFIVAIILSICAVKICNKRKRRKQEKELLSAYNMVACRVTDSRNGQGPQGTVPLKKSRKSRIPGVNLLRKIVSPSSPELGGRRCRPLGKISRAADGRFVIADSVLSSADNSILDASSSDDGGFLPSQQQHKSSWRRPLVGTSQLSLRSECSGFSVGRPPVGAALAPLSPPVHPLEARAGHCHAADGPICAISSARFLASSPACAAGLRPAGAAAGAYLSPDLSSVRPGEGSSCLHSPRPAAAPYLQLRNVHQRYSQELPSLKAIHAESQRFVPVQPLATSSPPQGGPGRPRARLPPRHARHARSAPELAEAEAAGCGAPSPEPPPEASPESRSSSSGFGSKNTSQQNQSSRSGSTVAEWRPPPYRPPPPPLSVGRWLELQLGPHQQRQLAQLKPAALHQRLGGLLLQPPAAPHQGLDAGSVDGHYEFDPASCTPTPTSASTPTREERPPQHQMPPAIHLHTPATARRQQPPAQQPQARCSRDHIEARVQAMKAEFHQFRQRQARRRQSAHLESAC
ncbi:protein turtle-like isoform X3 [Phymastichus coffea]|uniref:protein turtle-like isoform X3 n=1 Tax=Phymastichus coffea TaxID=108790 RepID=UPI00273ABBD3|nr:protein turtle-like isoform X3 [Phymastichus coffea]